jgi:hypothetical protein
MTSSPVWQKITDWRVLLAATTVVTALFMFYNLSGLSLRNWDEGIHAEVSREVIETGNWLDLHFMGDEYFRKPPLKFWLSAALMKIDGPTEWAARAPNAAAGIIVVALLALWIWQVTKDRWSIPLMGGFLLSTTLYFMHTFRSGETDGVLALFTLFGVYAYWRAKERPRWIYWSAASLGLAIMTKSAAGVVPIIVMVIDAIITGSWRVIGWRRVLWSIGIASAVVLPWHLIELARFGKEFWNDYFFLHIVRRGTEAIVNPTAGPFWYFKIIWLRLYPTLLITVPALLVIMRSLIRDRVKDVRLFWLMWFVVGFVIDTTAESKLDWYLLPYYFPLLLLTTFVVIDWLKNPERDWLRSVGLLLVSISAFTTLPDRINVESNVRYVLPQHFLKLVGVTDPNPFSVAVGVTLVGAVAFWLARKFWKPLRESERSERIALAAFCVYLIACGLWVNMVRIVKETAPLGYKEAMAYIEANPKPNTSLLLFNTSIWSNPAGYFYWHRHNVGPVRDAGPKPENLERLSRDPGVYIFSHIENPVPVFAERPLRVVGTWNEIVVLDRP